MPSQRVYLGNIPDDTRDRDVERFLKGYGRLREVALKNGYGFVEFENYRDADDAVHDLDGKDLLGSRVRVEMAKERRRGGGDRDRYGDRGGRRSSPRRYGGGGGGGGGGGRDRGRRGNPPGRKTDYRIIVENLSSKTSWQDLKDYFRSCGEITYTNAHKPRQNEGLVEFADRKGMEAALEKLDDTDLDGRRIKLVQEKMGGGGGGGGRGRSRSDSRSRSRSRSRSPRSRSRSRSKSRDRGRSRSRSNSRNGDDKRADDDDQKAGGGGGGSRSPRSKSRSKSRSRSKSADRNGDMD